MNKPLRYRCILCFGRGMMDSWYVVNITPKMWKLNDDHWFYDMFESICFDQVIRAFQKEVLAELGSLHTNSLPPVLESFALCFQTLDVNGKDTDDSEILQEREVFLYQLTGRLARELRLLRPQDASRLLQAIDRLGLVDPRLLGMAAELVPQRLALWKSEDLLALLEAYAAAENADAFMVPCLRRSLIPLLSPQVKREHLDDMQMVRAAEAFSKLRLGIWIWWLWCSLMTVWSSFESHCLRSQWLVPVIIYDHLIPILQLQSSPNSHLHRCSHSVRSLFDLRKDHAGLVSLLSLRSPWAEGSVASCQLALASVAVQHMMEAPWAEAVTRIMDKATKDAEKLDDGARWGMSKLCEYHEISWKELIVVYMV